MNDRDKRAREIMVEIEAILLKEWDPIGVKDEPMAQDEYQMYVGGVYRLLASRATDAEVAAHLCHIEVDRMGFKETTLAMLLPVARKLKALKVGLDDGSAA